MQENSNNISDILEHQVSALQLELHNMKSDHYILSELSMTWENHLALNLEELTEALSVDQEQDSERGEPSKGYATKHRIRIAAFTCELMIEEQERHDDIQKLVEDCINEWIGVFRARCRSFQQSEIRP